VAIKFGTSGWRGIIGEDFTFRNVRLVTKAVANLIHTYGRIDGGILVGYDTRFLSERFAQETAKILSNEDIKTSITNRDAPTPAISYYIMNNSLEGGINFTASHNSAEYNGLKFFSSTGSVALPELTDLLEKEIDKLETAGAVIKTAPFGKSICVVDVKDDYLDFVKNKIDYKVFQNKKLKIGLDLLYGTARDYLDELLFDSGCMVDTLHNFRDPYFGGYSPQTTEENLTELRDLIREKHLSVGLATNADSDRFGVLDEKGRYVHPNLIIPLLLRYLIKDRGLTGAVGRSVATSHIIDFIARQNNMEVIETPVGFKYISSLFISDKIAFGGEESGGISIKGHLPLKDGILACILTAEMMAKTETPLSELIKEMFKEIGQKIFFKNRSFTIKPDEKLLVQKRINKIPSKLGGLKIVNINKSDGVKMYLEDDSWVLVRFSGTEPKFRIYAEGFSEKKVAALMKAAKEYYIV